MKRARAHSQDDRKFRTCKQQEGHPGVTDVSFGDVTYVVQTNYVKNKIKLLGTSQLAILISSLDFGILSFYLNDMVVIGPASLNSNNSMLILFST